MKAIFFAAGLLLLPMAASAQDTAAPASASYIEGGQWTYPTYADVINTHTTVRGDVVIDCALAPSGHATSCLVTTATPETMQDTDKLIGLAYLQYAAVDPKSVDGGILPGDRVKFHYSTHDLAHSDLADAAKLTISAADADMVARYQGSKWTYPSADIMAQSYPRDAVNQAIAGTAVIDCQIAPSGAMSSCDLLSESPTGYGFGEAAIRDFVCHCHVDPATVTDGIQPGDHHKFTYKWTIG